MQHTERLRLDWWSRRDAARRGETFLKCANIEKTNRNWWRRKKVLVTQKHTHLLSTFVTAGGISVHGASPNFCRANGFQMSGFPAGPAQSRCPFCQQICLKLGTFEQSFSSHLPEGERLLIKPFHLCIFDFRMGGAVGWTRGGVMVLSCESRLQDYSIRGGRCCCVTVQRKEKGHPLL